MILKSFRQIKLDPEEDKTSQFVKGVKSGTDSTQGALYGFLSLLADATNMGNTQEYLVDKAQENFIEAEKNAGPRLTEINSIRDSSDWAMNTIGSMIPTAILGLGSGAIGKKVASKVIQNNIEKYVTNKVLNEAGKKVLSGGMKTGVVAGMMPIEAGSNYAEDAIKHGAENAQVIPALVTGTAAASLEILGGNYRFIDKVLGPKTAKAFKVISQKPGAEKLTKRILKEAIIQAPEEAFQEFAQEFLSSVNEKWTAVPKEKYKLLSKENALKWVDAAGAGGLAGSVFSVPTAFSVNTENSSDEGQPISDNNIEDNKQNVINEQRIPKSIVDPVIPSRPKDLSINPDMETFKKSISELKRKKALNPKPSQIKDVSVKPDMDFKGRVSPVETAEELNVFDLAKALGKKKGDPLTRDDIKKIIDIKNRASERDIQLAEEFSQPVNKSFQEPDESPNLDIMPDKNVKTEWDKMIQKTVDNDKNRYLKNIGKTPSETAALNSADIEINGGIPSKKKRHDLEFEIGSPYATYDNIIARYDRKDDPVHRWVRAKADNKFNKIPQIKELIDSIEDKNQKQVFRKNLSAINQGHDEVNKTYQFDKLINTISGIREKDRTIKELKEKIGTKKQIALDKYNEYISGLSDDQRIAVRDLIIDSPEKPSVQVLKIKKAIKNLGESSELSEEIDSGPVIQPDQKEMERKLDDFFKSDKLPAYKKALETGRMPNGRNLTGYDRKFIENEIKRIESENSGIADLENRGKSIKKTTAKPPKFQVRQKSNKWYSQLEQTLSNKLPETANPKRVLLDVKAWEKKNEFKKEELDWSGLEDWLLGQKDKVSKQEVLDYLSENNVRVGTTDMDGIKLHSLPVTNEMKQKALREGMPLFQNKIDKSGGKGDSELIKGGSNDLHKSKRLSSEHEQKAINQIRKAIDRRGKTKDGDIRIENPPGSTSKAVRKIANQFGLNVYFYSAPAIEGVADPNGFLWPDDPNIIYINVNTENPYISVLGHELIHSIKNQDNDLYNQLRNTLMDKTIGFTEYLKEMNVSRDVGGYDKLNLFEGYEEFIGDFCGDQFTNPDFWDKLHKKDQSFTQKLIDRVKKILKKIMDIGRNFISEDHFSDLEKAQTILADTLTKFSGSVKEKSMTSEKGKGDIPTVKTSVKPDGGNPFKDSIIKHPVYHGTSEEFDRFDKKTFGKSFGENHKAFFFTDDKFVAETYSQSVLRKKRYSKISEEIDRLRELSNRLYEDKNRLYKDIYGKNYKYSAFGNSDWEKLEHPYNDISKKIVKLDVERNSNIDSKDLIVKRVFLSLKNPLIVDLKGKTLNMLTDSKIISENLKKALENKHDGVVFKNVIDLGTTKGYGTTKPTTQYAVFSEDQIKIISPDQSSKDGGEISFSDSEANVFYAFGEKPKNTDRLYETDVFVNGKKISPPIVMVSEDFNSYQGQDMSWDEPFHSNRTLDSDEWFYHFSRYSPDEMVFAPKETAFFDYPTVAFGHIYRIKKNAGTVVQQYGGGEETRIVLSDGESIEYVGEREYVGVKKFNEKPWYHSSNEFGVDLKNLPNQSSAPEKGAQYSIKQEHISKYIPQIIKDSDTIWPFFQATRDIFKDWKEWGILDKLFKTMEWTKDSIGQLIFKATQDREHRKHTLFYELNTLNGKIKDGIGNALQEVKYKGADKLRKIKGFDIYGRKDKDKLPKEYQIIWDAINYMDEKEHPWGDTVKNDGTLIKGYKSILEGEGVDSDVINLIGSIRDGYDQSLEYMRKSLRDLMNESPASKDIVLDTIDGKPFTLLQAYNQMGNLKGFYAPRIRTGSHYVTAEKDGQFYRYHVDGATELIARTKGYKLAKELTNEGYANVSGVQKVDRLPEGIYENINIIDTGKAIDHSIRSLKNVDPELLTKFRVDILKNTADMFKARAFRSHRIGRTKQLVKGYIEDPQARFLIYQHQIAGGISKGEAAIQMMDALLGEYKTYKRNGSHWILSENGQEIDKIPVENDSDLSKKTKQFRHGGLDESKNPEAYQTYKEYISEQLRNPDQYDKMIALGKSIISFKYLGFNLRSAVVNTTAMVTTVPPALHEYASNGKSSWKDIGQAIINAGNDYLKYERYKNKKGGEKSGISDDEYSFLEDNRKNGYDLPQLTRDSMAALHGAYGHAWNSVLNYAMKPFAYTEKWNRGSTLLAGYRLARKQGMNDSDARKAARDATEKAHGIYGKSTLPIFAQGSNIAAKLAQMGYTYAKFGHNYIQMLNDLGPWNKKNYKALAFALSAPLVVGGVSSSVLASVIKTLINASDDDRDYEKLFYDTIRENLGDKAEHTARYGLFGSFGFDLSSSLGVGMEFPTTIKDLTGPFGGIWDDSNRLVKYMRTGQGLKAIETVLPSAFANPIKAIRESSDGSTTQRGNRVWDESGKPFKPNAKETALRAAGFRSARMATVQSRQYESKREVAKYKEEKSLIYEEYRAAQISRDIRKIGKVKTKIKEFNNRVIKNKMIKFVPLITDKTLKRQSNKLTKPTKRISAIFEEN